LDDNITLKENHQAKFYLTTFHKLSSLPSVKKEKCSCSFNKYCRQDKSSFINSV